MFQIISTIIAYEHIKKNYKSYSEYIYKMYDYYYKARTKKKYDKYRKDVNPF